MINYIQNASIQDLFTYQNRAECNRAVNKNVGKNSATLHIDLECRPSFPDANGFHKHYTSTIPYCTNGNKGLLSCTSIHVMGLVGYI